uniref:t-SNARE coiled-coil homology domain-containing protein n=1 Tax=Mucochytrium quahogii TaxID=96639 RepID=A0A7S2S0M6_9STRA|mmetsp:Transcript_17472/g.28243  ORF Transcript_17472/g.28243 Transcript_17472/m.28243 type:complete len:649 (+) Transcript_17472:212-2158(+)|eukprot:CAMPEP_0203756092 /NCGR_PEP_ID=MMETSP0098-20131031/9417_1 /ASSEMBLY_ACC=CAM_ASM_000208 /TAXON_ID=96639 /ORGANISM=" , Strain NY0313808BC1" /LENGTH=648 /DNA_ID=CAMNT_0050647809 /DNA_START=255 /DNA_END=2201 /DNA_ORIENTATION=-
MSDVTLLQKTLVSLSVACKDCDSASTALLSAVGKVDDARRNKSGRTASHLEALCKELAKKEEKTKLTVGNLKTLDEEFHALLKKCLTTGGQNFKAKKLKGDYDRKLSVRQSVSKAQNALKRSGYAGGELEKARKAEERRAPSLQTVDSFNNSALDPSQYGQSFHQLSQQDVALRSYDDEQTRELEKEQLRKIARDSALVEQMATELGSLLEVQQDDINVLEENTSDSVTKTMEGVKELSEARRKQANSGATKATLGTAAVGGLVGIVGGPVGMALGAGAGAIVGMVAGKGVAEVKRRSINAETRRVKALLAVRKRNRGQYVLEVSAFEAQAWSYMKRSWISSERIWVDEFGDKIEGAHPEHEMTAREARLFVLSQARSEASTKEELDEIKKIHEKELKESIEWEWASRKWEIVMDREDTDLAGWDFAQTLNSNKWKMEPTRGYVFRRRLWVRFLVGNPRRHHRENEPVMVGAHSVHVSMNDENEDGERHDLLRGIHSSASTTNTIINESLLRVNEQGEQITKSDRNATVVGDAALYAQRINRASHFSGAVKNMLTWPKGNLAETDDFANELDEQRRQHEAEQARRAKKRMETQPRDLLDATADNMEDTLRVTRVINNELDVQNLQLERVTEAVDRGNQGMLKATKSVK